MSSIRTGAFFTGNLVQILQLSVNGVIPLSANVDGNTYKLCGFLKRRQSMPIYRID